MNRRIILITCTCIVSFAFPLLAQNHRFEAEDGTLGGTQIANSAPGFSGNGYVTSFDSSDGSDYFRLNVDVPGGLYEMWVGYRSPFGDKGYNYRVDAQSGSGMFEQSAGFAEDRAGIFDLGSGTNVLEINQGWGYYDVDYLEFRPFTPPPIAAVPTQLSNPQANANTQRLMNYLVSQYGQKTLAGQEHNVWTNPSFPEPAYLARSGGLSPAVRGSDLVRYSPSRVAFGETNNNETEQSIQWAQQTGGIVTMSWHWNAPADLINQPGMEWWRGFYTDATTFDLPGALANPAGSDYQLILRDIDAIAVELQKYEDADVPVIWRPLHEAQGGWFWWGAHGPDAFKELWNLTYDRLTDHHGIDNLIWEFTSSAALGNHLDWYPGDDVVDMIGLDIYTSPDSSMSGEWYDVLAHYNGRKMIALSESGTLPNAELMGRFATAWSYFSPWYDRWQDIPAAELQALLSDEDIITLDELRSFPWSETFVPTGDFNFDRRFDCSDADALVAAITGGTEDAGFDLNGDGEVNDADLQHWLGEAGESLFGPGQSVLRGDANLDGNVDGADFLVWNDNKFGSDAGWCGGDFNADGQTDGADFLVWNDNKFTSSDDRVAVPEPGDSQLLLLTIALLIVRSSW